MSLLHHPEEEVVICSPMEGKITFNNKPVSGAKVERFIKWKDEVGEKDFVLTDNNGHFKLPVLTEQTQLPKLGEFVVAQEIRVFIDGKEYPIWAKAKREKGLYAELNGKPVNFRCELTDEMDIVKAGRGTLMTSCKWDNINKE